MDRIDLQAPIEIELARDEVASLRDFAYELLIKPLHEAVLIMDAELNKDTAESLKFNFDLNICDNIIHRLRQVYIADLTEEEAVNLYMSLRKLEAYVAEAKTEHE